MDTRELQHDGDITCDDTGKYRKPSYSKTEVVVENDEYTLNRKYMKHKDTPGFQRSYFELQKEGKRAHHVVIVRYEWRGPKSKLVITPHGRCEDPKDAEPYVRSKKSLYHQPERKENQRRVCAVHGQRNV